MDNWKSLYPYTGRRLDVGGHAMHYLDEGRGDKMAIVGIGSGLNCMMLGLEW